MVALAGVFDDEAGVDDGGGATFAGFEADDDVVVEFGFAVAWRLGDGDGPVFHVGEGFFEITDELPIDGNS